MVGIEVELWNTMHAPDGGGVPHNLTPSEVVQLRSLAETCGGWIAYDGVSGLPFGPMEEWLARVGTGARG